MLLDFDSDQITFICYLAGNGGNSLARLISLSPELYWDSEFEDDPKSKETGRAHYPGLLGEINEYGLTGPVIGRENGNKGRHLGTRDCPNKEYLKLAFSQAVEDLDELPRRFAHATHIRPGPIRAAFPNARIIDIRENNQFLAVRLLYEKLWKDVIPISVRQHIQGLPNEDIIEYKGLLIPRIDMPRVLYKVYLRYELGCRRRTKDIGDPGSLVVQYNDIMGSDWLPEYLRICKFIGVTPMIEQADIYMDNYLKHQWKRPLLS